MSDIISEVASQSPTAVVPHKNGIVIPETIQSSKDFRDWVASLEPTDRLLEYIEGRIVEKMACNSQASGLTLRLVGFLFNYFQEHPIGFLTGEAAGYQIGNENYIPDIGIILGRKRKDIERRGYNAFTPSIVVEVISADTRTERAELATKVTHYLAAGVVVWIVDEFRLEVMIYEPNSIEPMRLGIDATLRGEPLLPGFQLALRTLFEIDD